MRTGQLQTISPSLWGLLGRYFTVEQRSVAGRTYEIFADRLPSESAGVNRTPGVNFNPRQARLVEILVRESGVRDFELVLAALISAAASTVDLEAIAPVGTREILEEYLRPGARPEQAARARAVRLAELLDDLRHLHLRDDAVAARGGLRAAADRLLSIDPVGVPERLLTLVAAARDRVLRRGSSSIEARL